MMELLERLFGIRRTYIINVNKQGFNNEILTAIYFELLGPGITIEKTMTIDEDNMLVVVTARKKEIELLQKRLSDNNRVIFSIKRD